MNRLLAPIIIPVFLALSLTGCQSSAPPKQETTPRDLQWVAALVNHPESDQNRQCVRDSLQMLFALAALKDGEFDDRRVESALLDGLPDERIRKMRKADMVEWRRTHEPSYVASTHFNQCMLGNGNAPIASDRWLQCFLSVEPATMISIYHRTGRSMVMAVQAVTPYYPISVNPSEIAELGRQIYDLRTEADDMQFRENMFSDCLLLQER